MNAENSPLEDAGDGAVEAGIENTRVPKDEDDGSEAASSEDPLAPLDPPESCGERLRDFILRTLDHPFFQGLGIIVLILVIADGAFFFFLLMGWQTLCRPRTDCEPRNWWYNWSIQVLNVLFTYMAVVSIPWRSTNFLHITGCGCPRRNNTPGHDLYGRPVDDDIWFYVPLSRRLGITVILLLNCIFQFINQGTRIWYYSFELQDAYPGNLWTNIFFGLSFIMAGIGGAWLAYEVSLLRKKHPMKFGAGPIELARNFYKQHFGRKRRGSEDDDERIHDANDNERNGNEEEDARAVDEEIPDSGMAAADGHTHDPHRMSLCLEHPDPTREPRRRSLVPTDRSCMRMFAM